MEAPDPGVRVLLFVSYDGSRYSGFARQDNAVTVGGTLDAAIREIDPRASALSCSSRTDAGVHARHHPVSFVSQKKEIPSRGWVLGLSTKLPPDICVVQAARVPLHFDPRRDPLFKRYRYRLFSSRVEDPFFFRTCYRVGQTLDVSLMEREAAQLLGEHDFAAFRSSQDVREETTRRMTRCEVVPHPTHPSRLDIVVEGNRFMYNMVRIIAGTLVDVGRGRLEAGASERALRSKDRKDLGMTAPAKGLMLEHVELATPLDDVFPALDGRVQTDLRMRQALE